MEVSVWFLSQALQALGRLFCPGGSFLIVLSGPRLPTCPLRVSVTPPCVDHIQGSWVSDSALNLSVDKTFSNIPQSLEQAGHSGNLKKSRLLVLKQDTWTLIPASFVTLFKSLTHRLQLWSEKNNTYPSRPMELRDLNGIWQRKSLEGYKVLLQSQAWSIPTLLCSCEEKTPIPQGNRCLIWSRMRWFSGINLKI